MREQTLAVEHSVRRLVVDLPQDYDAARTDYERLVPSVDAAEFAAASSWAAQVAIAKSSAPLGFMRYGQMDIGEYMAGSSSRWQATQYLMGNHTIAETMFRYDPAVMLHAPLRTLIYVSPEGATRLTVDQPSLLFDSYHDPRIAEVGRYLDSLLAGVVDALGATVPHELAGAALNSSTPRGN
jgi:hypothetical protein